MFSEIFISAYGLAEEFICGLAHRFNVGRNVWQHKS